MTDRTPAANLYASLLASRICHDLISPLGAVGNGMELLDLSGVTGPEIDLIRRAVEDATRRVRFFRVAFGQAGDEQVLGHREIRDLLQRDADGRAVQVTWLATGELPRAEVRRAFLALMCLESAMPWGGACVIRPRATGWHLAGTAERMRDLPALWHLLETGAPGDVPPPPAELHFALLAQDLAGRPVHLERAPGEISLMF